MIDNKSEVKKAARKMISRYGDHALREVDLRILELRYHDRRGALELWCRIRERVASMIAERGADPRN